MIFLWGSAARNRRRVLSIRDAAPSAVEALARMFVDAEIEDDGTPAGRLRALLAVTEHRYVPGLHQGLMIGLTGFRREFQDPWPSSTDQVGHFLTAVRLSFDPNFLAFPLFGLALGSWGARDIPLRLVIGHEKKPDPPDASKIGIGTLLRALRHFRRQYKSATDQDVVNFQSGDLDAIDVGQGIGNSMADLRLSHKGWQFGKMIAAGHFRSGREVAEWIRLELGGASDSPTSSPRREGG